MCVPVSMRRALFGCAALSLFVTTGQLTWNRAVASTYSSPERIERSANPLFLMSTSNPVAGIQTGRTYEAKSPAPVQTEHGQSVFNDMRVTDLKKTGPGVLDYEVTYVDPASSIPTEIPASLFVQQAGADVTDKLPPVADEAAGQTGAGFNWRSWAGSAAAHTPTAPVAFAPGAGQGSTQLHAVADSMPAEIPAAATESSERPAPVHIETAPAPAAPAPAPAAPGAAPAPAPGMAGLANSIAHESSDNAASSDGPETSIISRSPSRTAGATTPTQATENAAGSDQSTSVTSKARKH